ncbi:alpha/beta family hydrolase [Actinomadura sp. DC4]|uniref:alpha/beta hydrolase family protein n=1 Tax=Actinomadura sp. DC4 TaxID=3055069 RepID=UPI0025B01548|nr:alpha/beta family hydrolase [Actinomadura sp. DC4]MDN3359471.1 alpha/beta hydrolase [Actinomadura sp. DC4]
MEIVTPAGPAEVALDHPPDREDAAFLLFLTHGSNGGVDAPDLLAVREEALRLGGAVAGVTQPYRLAGRRSPGAADGQDEAWLRVVAQVREPFGDVPLIQCGRSNGARVACRTALKAGARGVLALAFPLRPPWNPAKTREGELRGAGVEVVVVNGDRDPFGVPDPADATCVHVATGERHDLARNPSRVGAVAAEWLGRWSGQS